MYVINKNLYKIIAGRGRSAAIALCYLLATYQLDPFEAQKVLNKRRPQVFYTIFFISVY